MSEFSHKKHQPDPSFDLSLTDVSIDEIVELKMILGRRTGNSNALSRLFNGLYDLVEKQDHAPKYTVNFDGGTINTRKR